VVTDLGESAGSSSSARSRPPTADGPQGHTLLASRRLGRAPLALTLYNHNAERLKRKGAPIEWFAIQPAFARVNGIAIGRAGADPHAAVLFYDFMLSPEGQRILQKPTTCRPT